MDPLTIATAALGFAGLCASAVKVVRNTISRVQDIPATLSHLERNIELMTTLLSEVERVLRTDKETLTDTSLEERLVRALDGCHTTLKRLLPGLEELKNTQHWSRRVGILLKENIVIQMVANLEQEKGNLQLIIGTLNLRSNSYLISLLNSPIITPEKQHCFPDMALQSLDVDEDQTLVEGTPSIESSPSSTEFAFDEELINTKVYRKNLNRISRRTLRVLFDAESTETRKPQSRQSSAPNQRQALGNINDNGQNRVLEGSYQEEHRRKKRCRDESSLEVFDESSLPISQLANAMKRSRISR